MDNKIKEIRIIKKEDSKEEYTFVSENILNNMKNKSVNNEKESIKKSDERIEKKIHSGKSRHKGRKVLGKSIQGHSPVYE
ncbi:MAG TPA: hypothetical protein VLA74_14115 [Nitrososphaeraceae archaeon]|nr:hypothetical protein [Nitrososphaeraceae archaeon]